MRGIYRVKNARLQAMHAEAGALVERFENVQSEWVPREFNRRADALANMALS
jgi:probable phosphoglycerate mutase